MKNYFMIAKEIIAVLIFALAITTGFVTANAQSTKENSSESADLGGNTNNLKLDGLWLATVTFPDDFSLKVLFTFIPGRDETQGTLIDANEYQLTPNPVCTADQGVWKKTNLRTFIATHYAFCFDATNNFDPAGSIKVRDDIELNPKGTNFTGRQYIEIFDVDDQLTDTFEAQMTAVRISAEAPPPPTFSPRSLREMYQKYGRFSKKN